ncbi:alpha/beta fold hydrolase [Mollicutes bacterium LVI A0039]|nr:alpha/beta fold hydrolase [Mollicutes bacterium LVI A0039]
MNKNPIVALGANVYECDSDTVIVVVHGASEGSSRYIQFATLFSQHYNVITYNHPGHETSQAVDFGVEQILERSIQIIEFAQSNYKKCIIFAHSMGSVVIRNILEAVNPDTKIILSGAPVLTTFDRISSYAALGLLTFLPQNAVSSKLNYLTFDQKSSKVGLDNKAWVCSDAKVVNEYLTDQVSNFPFTNKSLKSLLKMTLVANRKNIYQTLANYQLFLVSGLTDGFTGNGKHYQFILNYATKANHRIYPNSFHEVHNDIDKMQLYKDIIKFIEGNIDGEN